MSYMCPKCGDNDGAVIFVKLEAIVREEDGTRLNAGFLRCFKINCDYESPIYPSKPQELDIEVK